MGIGKERKTKQVNIRVTPSEYRRLDKIASAEGKTISDLLMQDFRE